jgi:hypothetical protein
VLSVEYMKQIIIFILMVYTVQVQAQFTDTIVFNELNCDNPGGADNAEFLELFGQPNMALDGLVLVFFEGDIDQSYLAIDLDGFALNDEGFFVLGSAAVPNVDYILPNTIISNGPDAIALYEGNSSDFPNGTTPSSNQLVEAVVYETSDTEDNTLIQLLGLDALVANYSQLDETFQATTPDLSLSRIPDGGEPFSFSNYALRPLTPGTWNEPPCVADSLFSTSTTTLCYAQESASITWTTAGNNANPTFLITDSNDIIVDLTHEFNYNFSNYATGIYRIYCLNHTGSIDSLSLTAGSPIAEITSNECVSISDNYIVVTIENCSSCAGGIIALANTASAFCNAQPSPIMFANIGNASYENYLYLITNEEGTIYSYTADSIFLHDFEEGTYSVTGLSYSGEVSGITIGNFPSDIIATECLAFSGNNLQFDVYACVSFQSCNKLMISEYLEGSNGTKALELFNPSENEIDLSEYSIYQYANGLSTATNTLQLSGALAPMTTFVIANPSQGGSAGAADPVVLQRADVIHPIVNFNGNDALELRHNDTIVDVIGVVGENPGSNVGWTVGNASTTDVDMVRQFDIQSPVEVWDVSSLQWNTYSNVTTSNLGNHYFKRCTEETFGGFLDDAIVVSEETSTLTIGVQCNYVNSPISLSIQWVSGSASGEDYVLNVPETFEFSAIHNVLYFTLSLIDDSTPEGSETILLTLQSDSDIVWFNQRLLITIAASDENCSGGIVGALNSAALNQCTDIENPPLEIEVNSDFPINNYRYIITDTNEVIVAIAPENTLQLDTLGEGVFHIWGLSYNGSLDSTGILPGSQIEFINANECASLSDNFLTVTRGSCLTYGCESDSIRFSDGNTFMTLCSGIQPTEISLLHNGESIDDLYTFFIIDSSGNIHDSNEGNWDVQDVTTGHYRVFGVSHLEEFTDSTIAMGMPFSEITSNTCFEISENQLDIYVYDCLEHAPCTQLFISEMIEHTQSNKALELYNPSPFPIDMSAYQLKQYANGSSVPTCTQALTGILPAHEVLVIAAPTTGAGSIDATLVNATDVTSDCAFLTGNDAIELIYQGEAIDVIGVVGEDSGGTGWLFGNSSTTNRTLVRRSDVTSPSTNWNITSGQWLSFSSDDYSHIGSHESWNCGWNVAPIVGFESTTQVVAETDGLLLTIPIQIENESESFQLIASLAGSATPGDDYTITGPTEFDLTEGIEEVSLGILLIEDEISEGDETIIVTLSSAQDVFFTQNIHTIIVSENVGIKKLKEESIQLYPNPAQNEFTIESNYPIRDANLIDIQGRIIDSMPSFETQKKIKWSTNKIKAGSYIVQLELDDFITRLPLVIVH